MKLVVLFVALFAVAGIDAWTSDYYSYWDPNNRCPPIKARAKACTTGSCGDNLLVTMYGIPVNCALLTISGNEKFTPTGTFYEVFSDSIDSPDDVSMGYPVDGVTGSNTSFTSSVTALQIDVPENCCQACKLYNGQGDYSDYPRCDFFQHFPVNGDGSGTGTCFMYTGSGFPPCRGDTYTKNMISIVGAACKNSSIRHDPHLTGAQGTPYDFSGMPDQTFALISDEKLEINMRLSGYLDERTESATLLKDGKAVRTWIRELGIMWVDYMGKQHRLTMLARSGKIVSRGPGLLRSAFLNGKSIPRMQAGDKFVGSGGLVLKMESASMEGPYEVDQYNLVINDLLDMTLRLRVAHKLLQTEAESQCHFSLGVNSLTATENIHGVLGQTYRKDHAQRAEDFSLVAAKLHHNIQADGPDGKGFLDGVASDYRTSGVLMADSKFNVYVAGLARSV